MSTSPCKRCNRETDDYELLANGDNCSECWDIENEEDNDDEDEVF